MQALKTQHEFTHIPESAERGTQLIAGNAFDYSHSESLALSSVQPTARELIDI